MGYTHYWDSKGFTSEQWRALAAEVWRQVEAAQCQGVPLAEKYDTPESPPQVNEAFICLNGVGEDGHETFVLERGATAFDFCKTARKPYDEAVGKILAYAQAIAPGVFTTTNDDEREY